MKNLCFLLLLAFIVACNSSEEMNTIPGQVKITNGIIQGNVDNEKGLETFLGIPFAKPPLGELRWKAPQPVENWEGVKETKTFGDRPMQVKLWDDLNYRSEKINEDCLYLNVWAPTEKTKEAMPVLVYIHGGGLSAGDGSEKRYDGASMAQKGMVVVTINYRLNIFGYFAHPELSKENAYKASGNYGYLDQCAALEWVNKNISAFGGNPKKVTIAGESAGSISVAAHMISPLSKHLIAGAIGESGAPIKPTLYPRSVEEVEQNGIDFAKRIEKKSLAELRTMSADELFEAYKKDGSPRFPTTLDGYFFPKTTAEVFEAKEQAQIPLLIGWNSAEIPGQFFMQGLPYTKENFMAKTKTRFPDHYEEILKLYPHESEEEVELSATALASDDFIVFSTWKWFDLHRKNSDQPVYRYLYDKHRPYLRAVKDTLSSDAPATPPAIGAPHACEIEYCMGNLHLLEDYWAWTPDDYTVSKTMQEYFANFVKTGNPNADGLVKWPNSNSDIKGPSIMVIDTESYPALPKNENRYEFLDKVYQ